MTPTVAVAIPLGLNLLALADAASRAIDAAGRRVNRPGPGPGSLSDAGLDYTVVPGSALVALGSPLVDFWRAESTVHLVRRLLGVPGLIPDPNAASGVNVNRLDPGPGYERHVDARPYTAVLYLNRCVGGELVVELPGRDLVLEPAPGLLVAFDGAALPHRVRPVTAGVRLSAPMAYIDPDSPVARPAGLDQHLYQE